MSNVNKTVALTVKQFAALDELADRKYDGNFSRALRASLKISNDSGPKITVSDERMVHL